MLQEFQEATAWNWRSQTLRSWQITKRYNEFAALYEACTPRGRATEVPEKSFCDMWQGWFMERVPSRLVCCSAEKGLFILGSASSLCSPEVLKKRLASIPMMPAKLGAQKFPAGPSGTPTSLPRPMFGQGSDEAWVWFGLTSLANSSWLQLELPEVSGTAVPSSKTLRCSCGCWRFQAVRVCTVPAVLCCAPVAPEVCAWILGTKEERTQWLPEASVHKATGGAGFWVGSQRPLELARRGFPAGWESRSDTDTNCEKDARFWNVLDQVAQLVKLGWFSECIKDSKIRFSQANP